MYLCTQNSNIYTFVHVARQTTNMQARGQATIEITLYHHGHVQLAKHYWSIEHVY